MSPCLTIQTHRHQMLWKQAWIQKNSLCYVWYSLKNRCNTRSSDISFSVIVEVEHVWNVMAHAQKPDLVFQRNGQVHLNRRGSQFSRLLAGKGCGSAGRPWIDSVPRYSARVVATLSNHLFPLHFLSHASPCAITFRTASNTVPCQLFYWWLIEIQE